MPFLGVIFLKVKIFAVALLFLLIGAAVANTVFLTRGIDRITESVRALKIDEPTEEAEAEAKDLYEDYRRWEQFFSLTVSHRDLTDVESLFSEMLGYLGVSDADGARVAKSRLIDALSHLRRLSGFNIGSVF